MARKPGSGLAAASVATRFQPGNPGRPKGARHKLSENFVVALANDFEKNGIEAIATVRVERPHEYLKVIASLMPKHVEVKDVALDELERDELAALVDAVREARRARTSGEEGVRH